MNPKYERLKQLFTQKHIAYEFSPSFLFSRRKVFLNVNDEIAEIDMFPKKVASLLIFGGFGLFWLGISFLTEGELTMWETIFTITIFILFSVLPCVWVLPNYRKVCIINRMECTITISLPRTFKTYWLKNPPAVTIDFMNATFDFFAMQAGKPGFLNIRTPDGSRSMNITTLFDNALQQMSFLTWYMDKNRPLPPGEVFDPYREKDYLRREAEGFPDPIFLSLLPTPENTLEREEERLQREVKFFEQIERDLYQFKQDEPEEFLEFLELSNRMSTNIVNEKIRRFFKSRGNKK